MSSQEKAWRQALLWSVVGSMKLGIMSDIQAGIIPPTVKSFAELHSYVDANEYGGFCIEEFAEQLAKVFGGRSADGCMPDACIAFMNEAQNAIDAWIKGESTPSAILTTTDGV